jgi:hypothetical protein
VAEYDRLPAVRGVDLMGQRGWKADDPELVRTLDLYHHLKSAAATARALGIPVSTVKSRVDSAKQLATTPAPQPQQEYPARQVASIENGVVLIGSDCHYWAGEATTAHRAFVQACKDHKPNIIVMNGDVLDGASISRHSPLQWESNPTLIEEMEACQERLHEICMAAPKARKVWTLGNHDARYEARLAAVAPEFANIKGVHLKDHFPLWETCWSIWLNSAVVVKHRWKGGVHATHNNALNSGKSMVTGHLHSLKVTPYSDYNGTRFGVDTGTLAEPYGEQFQYSEDNPVNWRSGFALLTFENYELRWPEVIHVVGAGVVEFRGKGYSV